MPASLVQLRPGSPQVEWTGPDTTVCLSRARSDRIEPDEPGRDLFQIIFHHFPSCLLLCFQSLQKQLTFSGFPCCAVSSKNFKKIQFPCICLCEWAGLKKLGSRASFSQVWLGSQSLCRNREVTINMFSLFAPLVGAVLLLLCLWIDKYSFCFVEKCLLKSPTFNLSCRSYYLKKRTRQRQRNNKILIW